MNQIDYIILFGTLSFDLIWFDLNMNVIITLPMIMTLKVIQCKYTKITHTHTYPDPYYIQQVQKQLESSTQSQCHIRWLWKVCKTTKMTKLDRSPNVFSSIESSLFTTTLWLLLYVSNQHVAVQYSVDSVIPGWKGSTLWATSDFWHMYADIDMGKGYGIPGMDTSELI